MQFFGEVQIVTANKQPGEKENKIYLKTPIICLVGVFYLPKN
jgi:hypothetical protein